MKLKTVLMLGTMMVSSFASAGAAWAQDDPYPYCQLLTLPMPGAPVAPAPAPAAANGAPAAAGTAADPAKPVVPSIVDLIQKTTDAKDIVNQILTAGAPVKPEELEKYYGDVYAEIRSSYIDMTKLDKLAAYKDKYKGKLTTWVELNDAIHDLVNAVGDRWTWYHDPAQVLSRQISALVDQNINFGAGLRRADDGSMIVESVGPGMTAQSVGIREGDTIVSVDGKELKGMTVEAASKLLEKKDGDLLRVVSIQDGQTVQSDYTLHAPAKDAQKPAAAVIANNIAYIKLPSFMSVPQFNQLVSVLVAMDQKVPGGVQGIVLDLRYNGGGYVEMAKALIETLTQRGVILHERWRDDRAVSDLTTTILNTPSVKQEQFTAAQIDALADLKKLPLVVLINGSSASAAEIVAGSLQEARPNTLVLGERSFGKGVEMLVQTLPTCGQLAITARTYTLPSGKWLHHVGITPDMVVHQPRDSRDDAQLSAALNYLLAKTATNGANVVQMQPEDHTILGTTPDRPFEPKLNTWKLYIDAHRGDITRGAVGGFLFLILGFYCWLTRSKKKS